MKQFNLSYFHNKRIQIIIKHFIRKSKNYKSLDENTVEQTILLLPASLNIDSLDWSFFQELFNKGSNQKMKQCICILIREFIINNCYNAEQKEFFEPFKFLLSKGLTKALLSIFSQSLMPQNLIIHQTNKCNNYYVTDCTNIFLCNLLREFIIHSSSAYCPEFYEYFEKSLCNTNIEKITDFNATTFRKQYYFFKKLKNSIHSLTLLKKLYIYLLNHPEGKDILCWQDGIDLNMLQSPAFNQNYEKGFLPTPLNPFDAFPKFDKWLVMPNGEEKMTTQLNHFTYLPIDFSFCENSTFREYAKHWFWHSRKALRPRIEDVQIIMKFLNFINDLRVKFNLARMTRSTEKDNSITVEEVFSYKQYVQANKSPNRYINTIKKFLVYLQEHNICRVDPSAFNYLTTANNGQKTNTARDISDEDLIKLDTKLKEKANGNYKSTLYYILFHLALSTEFRISQIINLKVDCLIPGVKKEYYLESNTKVSNGEKIKIPITAYTRRYVETAIRFTQEVRDTCNNPEIKEHIFIWQQNNIFYQVLTAESFSEYLKNTCKELGIEKYTAQNLRDTYMTKSLEYAIKNNLSDLELRALTAHKNISTTTNHYVAEKINNYLEATHMIVIGDVTIKGNVTSETDHNEQDLVNDKCGYCPYDTCKRKEDNLDCLMCSGFIATIDRIPFFEQKIQQIDNEIKATQLIAEKERLTTIKRLYLAYLSKLLQLQEAAYE